MPATKRKSDTSGPSSSKRAKNIHAEAIETVENIISDPDGFDTPDNLDDVRRLLIGISQYARSLEEAVESSGPKEKSPKEIEAAAEKLRAAARSAIRKQMTWKPSCKTGGAKWLYDGVCSDPAVFGAVLKLDGPPTFKMKKMPPDQFKNAIGDLRASARYSDLYLRSDVNIKWNSAEGTFKFSGSYGA